MGFSDIQKRALGSKLRAKHIQTRTTSGTTLNYVTGWHAIAEANRIFGYDAWDRQTIEPRCVWKEQRQGRFACLYTAKVRITVRAGASVVVRDGIGTGLGRGDTENAAHEIGLKAAETDATKRALATFGNPFGLALYDKTRLTAPAGTAQGKQLILRSTTGENEHYATPKALAEAMKGRIEALRSLREVYGFWETNMEAFLELAKQPDNPVGELLDALKERGRNLKADELSVSNAGTDNESVEQIRDEPADTETQNMATRARPKEHRARDKAHLRYVARHPCVVCGRFPTQAHHLRFAQQGAMGMKVSDEFTVPLCNGHHDSLHQTGDEVAWWARHGIDPLEVAARLWAKPDKSDVADLDECITGRAQSRNRVLKRISDRTPAVKRLQDKGLSSSADQVKKPSGDGELL